MDRAVFPKDIGVAHLDPGVHFRVKTEILRVRTDHTPVSDLVVSADYNGPCDYRVALNLGARRDPNRAFNQHVGTNRNIGINLCFRVNDCRGVNHPGFLARKAGRLSIHEARVQWLKGPIAQLNAPPKRKALGA